MSKNYKLKESRFALESRKAAKKRGVVDTADRQTQVSSMNIFGKAETAKMKRRNMPTLIKPSDVPVGQSISGTILAVLDSQVSTIKGKLLHLKHENGTEFVFPCTGVIRSGLVPGVKDDDGQKLRAALEKEIGKKFVATRTPDKVSRQYGKTMYMFDVFTSDK